MSASAIRGLPRFGAKSGTDEPRRGAERPTFRRQPLKKRFDASQEVWLLYFSGVP